MKTIFSMILKRLHLAAVIFFIPAAFAADLYLPPEAFITGENSHFGVIGDFNADGADDMLAVFQIQDKTTGTYTSTRINFLMGRSPGAHNIEKTFLLPFRVLSVVTGDFNGDGNPDLAIAQDKVDGVSDPYCGTQRGTVIFFGSHVDLQPDLQFAACMSDTPPNELWAVDANSDNLTDMIVGDQLFLAKGDGSFVVSDFVPASGALIANYKGEIRSNW